MLLICFFFRKRKKEPRLVWGPDPIINNKYWSLAQVEGGFYSKTFVSEYYHINKKNDFDIYYDQFLKYNFNIPFFKSLIAIIKPYYIFLVAIVKFDIFHIPAHGFSLRNTPLWFIEAQLLKGIGKKIIVLPYGSDFYRYSNVYDVSLRHALLKSYPLAAINENNISKRFNYWNKRADIFIGGFQIDAVGRWDLLPFSILFINVEEWSVKEKISLNDGKNGIVKIIHTPNHRGFKGTEFIIAAVDQLKQEGLQIELILIENLPNSEVRRLMIDEADLLVEQIIATGYAMSGLEGMATGLPVLANLDSEYYTRAFRRYSYLNECPILSTTPENIVDNLRIMITNPELRVKLGKANRLYVEKYHSFNTAKFMFGKVYEKIWQKNENVDLINMFQSLNQASYNNKSPLINHPLVENKFINQKTING